MDKELISVAMSTYNEPVKMIEEAIESILNQTYSNVEVIVVVDNPANKEIVDFLESYGERIVVVKNENNLGLPASLNKAINIAKGNIIARMDSDDIAENNRLELQYNTLCEGNYDFVSSAIQLIDENGDNIDREYNIPTSLKIFEKKIRYGNCLAHPTFMFKREVFEKTGGYKEELLAAQDYEFVLNIYKKGLSIGFVSDKLLRYRIRSSSISSSKLIIQNFIRRYVQDIYYKKRKYDSEYISSCLRGETKEFKKFECDFKKYLSLNGIYGKILMILKSKYIRRHVYNIFMNKRLDKKYFG